ncbi:membrane hypothetical protein [Gammaproteobacteria bacterium]
MRKMMIVVLFALTTLPITYPITVHAAQKAPIVAQVESEENSPGSPNHRLLAAGAGAIIGIVTFNMLTYPFGSVPFVAAPLDPTPIDIALGSRVFATLVAGTGALIAHYLYGQEGEPQ